MDEWIECKICFNILEEPRMLTCQHTFCHRCIVKWLDDKNALVCPVCRLEMKLTLDKDDSSSPDEKIKRIPINRMVSDYLEKELKKSDRCIKHDGSEFIYFCVNHKKLACSECILKVCKPCHEKGCFTSVKDYAARPKFQSEVSAQKKELARTEEQINKFMKRLDDNVKQMDKDKTEIVQNIEVFAENAVDMIKSFKQRALNDIQAKQEAEASQIFKVVEKCNKLKNELGELIKSINFAKSGKPVSLISVFLSNEDKLQTISKTLYNEIAKYPQTVLSKDIDIILHEFKKLLQSDVQVTKLAWS